MKITGYRSLTTIHKWGRPIGDVNGLISSGITDVPIILLETDSGLTGVGLGAHSEIEKIFPAVEGEDPRAVSSLYEKMLARVFKTGHAGATYGTIGTLDMALWDLKAKIANEPLWKTLGGRDRFVPGYASGLCIGLDDNQLVEHYALWADRGFTSAKLKGGNDLVRDIRRLLAVKEVLARNSSRPAMMLDVNESWSRKQAIRHITEIEESLDLTWIEEPVRRWDANGHAAITRTCRCAVATGENLTGLDQYLPLFQAQGVDIVQAGMNWGITHFNRVAIAAHAHNLPISPVGYNGNPGAHAAAAAPNLLTVEVQDFGWPVGLRVDQQIMDGGIVLGDAPGLGIEVDEQVIVSSRQTGEWTVSNGPHVRPARAGLRLVPET